MAAGLENRENLNRGDQLEPRYCGSQAGIDDDDIRREALQQFEVRLRAQPYFLNAGRNSRLDDEPAVALDLRNHQRHDAERQQRLGAGPAERGNARPGLATWRLAQRASAHGRAARRRQGPCLRREQHGATADEREQSDFLFMQSGSRALCGEATGLKAIMTYLQSWCLSTLTAASRMRGRKALARACPIAARAFKASVTTFPIRRNSWIIPG